LATPTVVFESSDGVGGSARSHARGGYTFDITGHWLHFKDAHMRAWVEALMGDTLVEINRRAGVFMHGVHTPYPFQAHTYGLPTHVVAECVLGFVQAQLKKARGQLARCTTFEDYIRQCMGDGIAEHFMIPYNTKLWTVHPREMAHAWCGRFVPLPKLEQVVWGALQPQGDGSNLGYNASFLYPRTGGIGQLAAKLSEAVRHRIYLQHRAVRIDLQARVVHFANGARASFSNLVTSMPLTHLMACITEVPDDVQKSAARLRANQITWWDVGIRRPTPAGANHWTYYPGPEVPFFRVGCPSAVLASLAPEGCTSYYVEVAHAPGQSCGVDDAAVLAGLRRVGLVHADETPEVFVRSHLDCAYTIMDHAYGAARQTVLAWLSGQGVISTGRFGAWMYDSMEGALSAGRAAALQLADS
jgi:protoporphyrinogen oxidase